MLTVLFISLTITLSFGHDETYYMSDKIKKHFVQMLQDDECTTAWPEVQNCVDWFEDDNEEYTDDNLRYVITNVIPPYYVAPYCPFGVGEGYCLPAGATNCSQFYGLVCPAQAGRENTTGDVEVSQIQMYGFPLNPDPTNSTRPLNLYQLNPLQWWYDPAMNEEIIIPFKEDLFNLTDKRLHINFAMFNKYKSMLTVDRLKGGPPPPPNPAFQTVGVHLAGIQIKGPAEAEGYNVDAVGIPLNCGGHVTPPIGGGPLYHYHKASFCLMEYDKTFKQDEELKISEESILSAFEREVQSSTHSDLVGFANDGFGIYGFYDINGNQPLVDECNGHFGCLDDGCNDVVYHYHAHNYTWVPPNTFYPYWTGCLGPSKGICNTTVHEQYDNGANWCGPGCGYQICVQNGTSNNTLNQYIASFGDADWLNQFTVNPF